MRITRLIALTGIVLTYQLPGTAADCPGAVTAAVQKAHPGATVSSCKKEDEHGKQQYEVKLMAKDGRKLELDVDPAGAILLTEESVAVSSVPQVVIAALGAKYTAAKPTRAEKQTAADGTISYELAFTTGGKKKESTFKADGSLVEEE